LRVEKKNTENSRKNFTILRIKYINLNLWNDKKMCQPKKKFHRGKRSRNSRVE
jgi:hypothetical protein